MDDGGGISPPMCPGVVEEGHGTGNPDVVLKSIGRRHSSADAVSGVGDDRRPVLDDYRRPTFDDCSRPTFDDYRRPTFDDCRRPKFDEIRRPKFDEIRRPDSKKFADQI